MNLHTPRCSGRAFDRRGYHEIGTLTTLPSAREIVRVSSLISALTARGLLANVEVLIPFLRQSIFIFCYNSSPPPQLWTRKAMIPSQTDRPQPELCLRIFPLYVGVS